MPCICAGKKIKSARLPTAPKISGKMPKGKKGGGTGKAGASKASAQARKIATKTNPYKKGCACT